MKNTTTSTVSVPVFVVIKFIVEIKELVQFVNCKDIIYGNILYITYCTSFWCSVYYYYIKVVANARYFKLFSPHYVSMPMQYTELLRL